MNSLPRRGYIGGTRPGLRNPFGVGEFPFPVIFPGVRCATPGSDIPPLRGGGAGPAGPWSAATSRPPRPLAASSGMMLDAGAGCGTIADTADRSRSSCMFAPRSPARRRRPPRVEELERRDLLAGLAPTPLDQQMLEELNDIRANPPAYSDWAGVDLSGDAPAQPLAFNPLLIAAAQGHSQDMNDHNL